MPYNHSTWLLSIHENPSTWAGVEPTTLSTEGQRQTNHVTQPTQTRKLQPPDAGVAGAYVTSLELNNHSHDLHYFHQIVCLSPDAAIDPSDRRIYARYNCSSDCCQVIYSQFGLAIHQNDHQARRRFVEWAQNEIAVVPDFHKRILFSDEAHFWLNGYVNKQNCRIWSEANPQVYVETPLHPEKLTVWCALWAGGILLQKR
ncbi:hypothetical protein TNCV_1674301 [Trichonephila clavipes]|nr:hypothetical protein TNCV_1674301 [Trichonephila clavipes]